MHGRAPAREARASGRRLSPSRRASLVVALAAGVAIAALPGCGGDETPPPEAAPGELIAYSAGDGIHLVLPDGGKDWKVPGTGGLSGPRFAPDGRRFAAVDLGHCCKVYAVSIDGAGKELLPADSSTTPDWSPDATRLVTFVEEDLKLHVVHIADGHTAAVIPKSGNLPAWSPDGRTIAFQGDGADDLLRIFLSSPAGRGVRRLTDATGGDEGEVEAAWSPDGRRLAFSSDADGDFDIFVIGADGAGSRAVTATALDESTPSWSPDGSRLVFARTWPDRTAIVVLDLATQQETIVAGGGLGAGDLVFAPSWQPLPRTR